METNSSGYTIIILHFFGVLLSAAIFLDFFRMHDFPDGHTHRIIPVKNATLKW